jgi:hypothetical protein
MKYVINPTRYEDKVTDIMAYEFEILVAGQMRYVIRGTSNRVVNGDNTESLGDEAIAQMRSEKSGSAGNHGDLFSYPYDGEVACFSSLGSHLSQEGRCGDR